MADTQNKSKEKKKSSMMQFGTLNVRGMQKDYDKRELVKDVMKYNLDIMAVTETHIKEEEEIIEIEGTDEKGKRKKYILYLVNEEDNHHHGVGIIIRKELKPIFRKISNRICIVKIKHDKSNLVFIAAYAPTNQVSEKTPEIRDIFYEQLEKTIEGTSKRDILIIAGDFNAKVGSSRREYPECVGKYGKGETNSSGRVLIEMCAKHDLVITNTYFNHKMSHRTTWVAPERDFITHDGTPRRNPIRNQIDFVMVKKRDQMFVHDSRSFGGINTDTDHKLVKTSMKIKMQKIYNVNKTKQAPRLRTENFNLKEYQERYKVEVEESITRMEQEEQPQIIWNKIVATCKEVGERILGKTKRERKYESKELEELAKRKEKIKKEIECCQHTDQRKEKREEKKEIKKEMNKILKKLEQNDLEARLTELEESKNDSNKCHKVMNRIRKEGPKKTLCVQNEKGEMIGEEEEKVKIITEFFKKMLAPENAQLNKKYEPKEMRIPFEAEEIAESAKKLKNGKSAGIDGLQAEFIKYAPKQIHQKIADIYNHTARTGENPAELEMGILAPLQKPNKKAGPTVNLRPVILLSVLRKILTIIMIKRCWERFAGKIPVEQAAYQGGRSTTEQVFSIKILAETAIITSDYKIYLLLLDMSKAFDTVDRKKLFTKLEEILNDDELHLLSILTRTPKLMVKVNKCHGESFETYVGIMQGDCLSAVLFIFYLASCLNTEMENIPCKTLIINPKYSDDITYAAVDKENIDFMKNNIPKKLEENNLKINHDKTEEYEIPRPPPPPPTMKTLIKHKEDKILWSDLDWLVNYKIPEKEDKTPDWRCCKLLGSLLDTEKDISRRRGLAVDAMKKLRKIFRSNRISIELKIRTFNTYISSIFLYNSEIWTLTKSLEDKIDAFHRRQLRYAVGIVWPKKIRNEDLYLLTRAEKWSRTIKRRRLNWLGHLMRLSPDTPARKSLKNSLEVRGKMRGRAKSTWLSRIKKDLGAGNINLNLKKPNETINTLEEITANRRQWRNTIRVLMR